MTSSVVCIVCAVEPSEPAVCYVDASEIFLDGMELPEKEVVIDGVSHEESWISEALQEALPNATLPTATRKRKRSDDDDSDDDDDDDSEDGDSEDGDSEGKTVHDKMAERVYTLIEEFEKYTVRHRPDGAKVVLTISIIEG